MRKFLGIAGGIILLVVAFLAFGAYRQRQAALQAEANMQTAPLVRGKLLAQIGASGTVRSNQSAMLSWQTSGAVGSVQVRAGTSVEEGQVLAELALSSVPQNVLLAQADLVNAQKELDRLLNSSIAQAQALQAVEDALRAYEQREDNLQARQAEAQLALVMANDALNEAERKRTNLNYPRANQATLDTAEADYILAETEVDRAQERFNEVSGRPSDDPVRALALAQLSTAKAKRDATLRTVNWYKGDRSEQEIAEADANLAKAQAQLLEAQQEWDRAMAGLSPAEVKILEANLEDAQREYERVKDGPHPDDIAVAKVRVAAAQATLDQVYLLAPFDGIITQVSILPGDQVSPGSIAFRLDDLSRLLVDALVSEVDINQVEAGQEVLLTFDSILGSEYHGKVVEVASVGQIDQGVVSFKVTVEMSDADQLVKPGMTSAVSITVSELDDVLLVPNRAVRALDGERVVYTLRNGSPLPVPVKVTLGKSSDLYSEVLESELREGDLIVLNPQTNALQFGPGSGGGGMFR